MYVCMYAHMYAFASGPQSFLPNLHGMAAEWSRLRKDEPEKLTSPLRVVLLKAVLMEMETRAKLAIQKEKQAVIDMKWLTEMEGWTYMQWNAQKNQLELQEDQKPLPHETLMESLHELQRLVTSGSIKKFASLRGIPQEPQAEWIHFQLELGFRPQGDRLWELLLPLINCSSLHPWVHAFAETDRALRTGQPDRAGCDQMVKLAAPREPSAPCRDLRAPDLPDIPPSISTTSDSALPTAFSTPCAALLRACLRNVDSTACYMNAALFAISWALYQDPTFDTGPVAAIHRSLALRPTTLLLQNMIWRGILGNWAQPNRQHDMHELLLHVMPRLQLGEVQGTWQTGRLEETGTIVCNSADTALPITLDIPCVGRGLQQCASVALPALSHCTASVPSRSCLHSSLSVQACCRGKLMQRHSVPA